MPIYEYLCRHCKKPFEKLSPMSVDHSSVECPYCGKTEAERVLSEFFSMTASGQPSSCPLPGPGCGPQGCSTCDFN